MSKNNGVKNHGVTVIVEEATKVTPAQIKYLQRLVDKKKPNKKSDLLLLISISIIIILTFVVSMYANVLTDNKTEKKTKLVKFEEEFCNKLNKEKTIRKAANWIYNNIEQKEYIEYRDLKTILYDGEGACFDCVRLMYKVIDSYFTPILVVVFDEDKTKGHAYVLWYDTKSNNVMQYDTWEGVINTGVKGSIDNYCNKYLTLPDGDRWLTLQYVNERGVITNTIIRPKK